jgi:hypothetical protein
MIGKLIGFVMVLFAMATGAILMYFYVQQDYVGKNKFRIDRVRTKFEGKLTALFRFGFLRMKSVPGYEADERDGLAIGRILWVEDGKIRKQIALPVFQILDSAGQLRFVIEAGKADGRGCIVAQKITGSSFGVPTKGIPQVFFVDENTRI